MKVSSPFFMLLLQLSLYHSQCFVSSTGRFGLRLLYSPYTAKAWSSPLKTDSSVDVESSSSSVFATPPELSNQLLNGLQEALVEFNSTAAQQLIRDISAMRNNGTDQSSIDSLLNDLLAKGPDRPVAPWFRPRALTRFSKRARMASLRRTLDLTTPPPNEDDEYKDSAADKLRLRRRALVALLRTLSSASEDNNTGCIAISFLEQKAQREKKSLNGNEDLTARLPEGLETPRYEVLLRNPNGLEIRHYEPFSVCSVSMSQPRPVDAFKTDATVSDPTTGGARAFGALAGYLFGKNQKKEAMAMTTPVLTRGKEGSKQMSFVLPSKFWEEGSLQRAPKPLQGSGVTLEQDNGGDRAVIMFGGYASKQETERRKKQLLTSLAKNKQWEAVSDEPILSQYNDPFTPPWKRLNEVSVSVRPRL